MQPQGRGTQDTELVSQTLTRLYFDKGTQSFDLNLSSCPTLQDLKNHLQPKEKEQNKPKLLYYLNGTKKRWIKDEEDYKTYLKAKSHLNHLDLYSVDQISPLSNTFAENAGRLIQTYSISSMKEERADQIPQESWLLGNWLIWGETFVPKEVYNDFRFDVQSMFSTERKQNVSYEARQMNEYLLQSLESFEPEAKRFDHTESGVSCLLFSIYMKVAQELSSGSDQKDNSLWKLAAWKEKETRIELNDNVNNFHITYQSKVVIPTIKPSPKESKIEQTSQKKKKVSMFLKQELTPEQKMDRYIVLDTIHSTTSRFLKNELSQEEYWKANKEASEQRTISDDQVLKFVTEVAKAKAAYVGRYLHLQPTDQQDGVLLPIEDNQQVAIVGDWGSGLQDAFNLLDNLAKTATTIIHLGDVYYAGFPEEFAKLTNHIKVLRNKYPKLRYYTIPGNHDFYTNGIPFYDYLDNCNDKPEHKQKFGFFCLRNKSNTLQYIGLDTGYSDSTWYGEIDFSYEGAYVYPKELDWAINKIKNFSGQTILLTHHQAFSPYDKILGNQTKFGWYNPQVDTTLCEQLFQVLPKVSVWFWGHEHRLNMLKGNAYGIPCSRTVGNSSFQVHHKDTYDVKYNDYDPTLPRCNPEKNDKQDPDLPYYDHTGCSIKLQQIDKIRVQYTDMTSSYLQKSNITRVFSEKIRKPIYRDVLANKPYRVKDACGLSFCFAQTTLGGKYIWLNYKPNDLIFERASDPKYTGPITTGMELYIKVMDNNEYLYLSTFSYVKTGSKDSNVGKFKFMTTRSTIQTGDSLILVNISNGKEYTIGRYYFPTRPFGYYCLATGSGTEYTPVQIYDPTDINTDLPQ